MGEEELGVAFLPVQRTQQHAGPLQLGSGERRARVGGVVIVFPRQQQELTVLTEALLLLREGDKCPQP